MNIGSWIVFGLIAGIIANMLDYRPARGGIVGAIILGIAGALVGGFLGNTIFGIGVTGFNLSSFIVAVVGSLILLLIGRMLSRA